MTLRGRGVTYSVEAPTLVGMDRARRRLVVGLVALAGATGAVATTDGDQGRSAGAATGTLEIGGAAAASTGAVRMGPGALTFPMAVTPRCDILSNFGEPRSSGRLHEGIDLLATLGQEIYAAEPGTLVQQYVATGPQASLSGNAWMLRARDGDEYFYAHLSAFATGLEVGSSVAAGQVFGSVGDTGNPGAGNYHLHFEVHPGGGAAIDPLTVLAPIPTGCRVY